MQELILIKKEIKEITLGIGDEDTKAFRVLHGFSSHFLSKSGYNWVGHQFFQTLFGANRQWDVDVCLVWSRLSVLQL